MRNIWTVFDHRATYQEKSVRKGIFEEYLSIKQQISMEVFLYLYLYLEGITRLNANLYTQWKTASKKNFDEYPDTKLVNNKNKLRTTHNIAIGANIECMQTCLELNRCLAINIIKEKNKILSCEFFATTSGGFIPYQNTDLFTTSLLQCSGYCEELSYLNVCNKCQCVSLCGGSIPFYCDCTKRLTDPIKDCRPPVRMYGYPLAGLYNVQYDGDIKVKTFPGFCQIHEREMHGELWLTIFRRLNSKKLLIENNINGYGKPYYDNYFMGYKYLAEITKKQGKNMSMVLVDQYKNRIYVDFTAVKVREINHSSAKYEISYDGVSNNRCLKGDLLSLGKSCLNTEECAINRFIQSTPIDYIATTILLQSIDQEFGRVLTKETLLMANVNFDKNICISFEFRFEKDSICKIVAFKPSSEMLYLNVHINVKNNIIYFNTKEFPVLISTSHLYTDRYNKVHFQITKRRHNNKTRLTKDVFINNVNVFYGSSEKTMGTKNINVFSCFESSCGSCSIRNLFIDGKALLQEEET